VEILFDDKNHFVKVSAKSDEISGIAANGYYQKFHLKRVVGFESKLVLTHNILHLFPGPEIEGCSVLR
jgi:hypothetical protein